MIRASRTAFVENPDGSIQCVVTIPRAHRAEALAGAPIALSELPGEPLSAIKIEGAQSAGFPTSETIADWTRRFRENKPYRFDPDGHGAIGIDPKEDSGGLLSVSAVRERELNNARNTMARAAISAIGKQPACWMGADYGDYDMTVTLETGKADSAADRPPAQTVGVNGFDAASVVEAVAGGSYAWDHPAAPHMATIFRHEPFQRFAMMMLHADAFAAPMECATRLITKAVKGKPMDAAVVALGRTMDDYVKWAEWSHVQVWPGA